MPTPSSRVRIHIYGHESADPQEVARYFGATFTDVIESESELAIFVVDPAAGISPETISLTILVLDIKDSMVSSALCL